MGRQSVCLLLLTEGLDRENWAENFFVEDFRVWREAAQHGRGEKGAGIPPMQARSAGEKFRPTSDSTVNEISDPRALSLRDNRRQCRSCLPGGTRSKGRESRRDPIDQVWGDMLFHD
jgi:hypothetical protein